MAEEAVFQINVLAGFKGREREGEREVREVSGCFFVFCLLFCEESGESDNVDDDSLLLNSISI